MLLTDRGGCRGYSERHPLEVRSLNIKGIEYLRIEEKSGVRLYYQKS